MVDPLPGQPVPSTLPPGWYPGRLRVEGWRVQAARTSNKNAFSQILGFHAKDRRVGFIRGHLVN